MKTAKDKTEHDPAPLEVTLGDNFRADLERDEDGPPVLVIRDGNVVKARLSGVGHDATLAGLRRLVDGIWLYQQAVAGMKFEAQRQARIGTPGETITVEISEANTDDLAHLEATAGNSGPGGQ